MRHPKGVKSRHRSAERGERLSAPCAGQRRPVQWRWFERVAVRMLRWIILVVTTILAVAPATAQRYDPHYPVCLQKWGQSGFTAIDCSYTSLDQCKETASGLSASCYANPYWPQAQQASPGRVHRPLGRVY
jgi:hypothetical protein